MSIYSSNQLKSKSSAAGLIILTFLIFTASLIFYKQFDYNPAVKAIYLKPELDSDHSLAEKQTKATSEKNAEIIEKEAKTIIELSNFFEPMSAPEFFDKITLSDKIDGKAELYLPSGFKSLQCQRFKLNYDDNLKSDDPLKSQNDDDDLKSHNDNKLLSHNNDQILTNLWIEVFIYDMTLPENAFAVFSRQRRENAPSSSIARYSYQTENALFFVHGHFYVEIIGSMPSSKAVKWIIEIGRAFIGQRPDLNPKKMEVPDLFPTGGLDKESITLTAADAFGFERFDNIYTASYTININDLNLKEDSRSLTMFLSKRSSSEEASELASDYADFLINFGGTKVDSNIKGVYIVEIMDAFEFVFSSGIYLAGIREAENLETAQNFAKAVISKLSENGGNLNIIEGKNEK